MSVAAVTMGRRLTEPFARGSDTLELTLSAIARDAARAAVDPYDFAEHAARFDRPPEPAYVLVARRDVEVDTTITLAWRGGSVDVRVPAGTLAGTSVAIPLGAAASPPPGPQLQTLRTDPPAPDGQPETWWGITALLGNIAKLLWVSGWERDRVRRELERVTAQRSRISALGRALDLLGADLGVPRFVPLAHTFDDGTLALLHLDDPVRPGPGQPDAEDRAARYRGVALAHHGVNAGGAAQPGVPGRFGGGFAFRAPAAELTIADHADFALDAARSTTVECFFKPDPGADGHVLSKQARPGAANDPGWALTLGEFGRGLARNVRWQCSDGRAAVAVFADVSLDTERFHHLAGVVDRAAGELRLLVDGTLRASAPLGRVGALTSAAALRLGRHGGAGAAGVTDELRVSAVARTGFAPVLGESDDSYRRRLGVFERWTLPSPAAIEAALNEAVGEIAGDPAPLVVDDTPATLVTGAAPVRVVPTAIPPGGHVDVLGRRRTREQDALGTIGDEERRLGSAWLTTFADARADVAAAPVRVLAAGEEPPDPSRMHGRCARSLTALLDRLASARAPGRVLVRSAFDPDPPDLHPPDPSRLDPSTPEGRAAAVTAAEARAADPRTVGRALLLEHPAVPLAELAAHAHAAGFDYVRHRGDLRGVLASVRGEERLTIAAAPPPAAGSGVDAVVGGTLDLTVTPAAPAADVRVEWVTIPCGRGRATFETAPTGTTVRVRATAPGVLTVRVEAFWHGATASGTRTLRIGPADLADGASIAADGEQGVGPAIADGTEPPPFLHPVHLLHVEEKPAAFDPGDNPHRMQRGTAARLTRLLELLEQSRARGTLRVHEAWDPAARDLRARGRRLLVSHSVLAAGALAARAHAAGFAYVARSGARVELRHGEEELLSLTAPAELAEEQAGDVAIAQGADARSVAVTADAVFSVNAGTDSVSELEPKTGAVRRAIKVGHRPVAVAVDPSGRRLYTADEGSATVSVVDLAGGALLAPIATGQAPADLLHHPRLARLYVACRGDATVRAIDTGRATQAGQAAIGAGRPRLGLARDGRLWVASDGEAAARLFAADPLAPAGQLALPGRPADIALAAGSDVGWVALPAVTSVSVLRTDVPSVTATVALAERPTALAIADGDAALYALGRRESGGALGFALDLAALEQSRFPLPRGSVRLVAAGAGRRLYAPVAGVGVAAFERGARASVALVATWRLGTGLGEELRWIARPFGEARGRFAGLSRPDTRLTGERAGPLLARAVASLGDHGPPYTFEVLLKPALDRPRTLIRKDQYDLLMNVLNLLHPIGVEVRTQRIREHVLEVREGLLEAFPDYTYPNFRVSGPAPAAPGQEA